MMNYGLFSDPIRRELATFTYMLAAAEAAVLGRGHQV
jgi:hypothetical protein